MAIKEKMIPFIPPILLTLRRKIFPLPQPKAEWEYLPDGWPKMQSDPNIPDWSSSRILDTQKKVWPSFLATVHSTGPWNICYESYASVLLRVTRDRKNLSFLDYGGMFGQYYELAKHIIPEISIQYSCKDFSFFHEYGKEIFPDAQFYDNDSFLAEKSFDLIMASGSIQYCQDWKNILALLIQAAKRYIYVTRLFCVMQRPTHVVIQRASFYGDNVIFPHWTINRAEFLEETGKHKIKLIHEYDLGERAPCPTESETIYYRGFLFERA